ncbi:hypothetical protein D3C78_1636890 [compost metagenome]
MGILLAFMFLWNMLGALILVPSLAVFLLPDLKSRTFAEGDGSVADGIDRPSRAVPAEQPLQMAQASP